MAHTNNIFLMQKHYLISVTEDLAICILLSAHLIIFWLETS